MDDTLYKASLAYRIARMVVKFILSGPFHPTYLPHLDSGLFRVIGYSPSTAVPGREKTGMTIVGVVWCETWNTLLGVCLCFPFVPVCVVPLTLAISWNKVLRNDVTLLHLQCFTSTSFRFFAVEKGRVSKGVLDRKKTGTYLLKPWGRNI